MKRFVVRATQGARWRQERRDAGSIDVSIAAIVAILLTFSLIQAGLWFNARSVASHAAQQGVDAGRSHNASGGDAREAAQSFVSRMRDSLHGGQVAVEGPAGGQLAVTVRGEAVGLIPGMPIAVEQRVQAPVEGWRE